MGTILFTLCNVMMYLTINGLRLVLVELQDLLSLPDALLVVDHLLHFGLLLEVLAALDLILDDLILLHESLVLLAHGLSLLCLSGFLGMGAAESNVDGTILNTIDLLLILLIFNLLLLFDGNLLIQGLDLAEELVLNIRRLLVFLYFLEAAHVFFLQDLQFVLAVVDVVRQPRHALLEFQLLFLPLLSRKSARTSLWLALKHASSGRRLAESHLILLVQSLIHEALLFGQTLRKLSLQSPYFLAQLLVLEMHVSYLLVLVHHRHLQELSCLLEILCLVRSLVGDLYDCSAQIFLQMLRVVRPQSLLPLLRRQHSEVVLMPTASLAT